MKIAYTIMLGIGLAAALAACSGNDTPATTTGGGTPPVAGTQDSFTSTVTQAASGAPEDQEPSDALEQTASTIPEDTEPAPI